MAARGDFHGLPTVIIKNEFLTLEVLAEAGPRIVRLIPAGSDQNILAEVPDVGFGTGNGRYNIIGGHRLWHAPEAMPRTYVPDNDPIELRNLPDGVELRQPVEALTGIRKEMLIQLSSNRAEVIVHHSLTNEGLWPIELAPWAITQVRLGGTAVLPQTSGNLDESGLLPNRQITLWPYSSWSDGRFQPHDDFVFIEGQPAPPFKLGYFNRHGWLSYLIDDVLFVKRFAPQFHQSHPDMNSNTEIYVNDRFLEMETLGPLTLLDSGETVTHTETWRIYTGLSAQPTSESMQALLSAIESE